MDEYLPYTEKPSVILLPLTAHLDTLSQLLDQQLDTLLEQEGGKFSDGDLEVEVKKLGLLSLSADKDTVRYRLPLSLKMKYDAGFTSINADGDIELSFFTQYQVDSSWNLETDTELEDYEWLRKPKLKLGPISLPASIVADWVVNFGKQEVAQLIDSQIRENVPLRTWVNDAWKTIREPVLLEEEYSVWMVANPQSLELGPISTLNRELNLQLKATCKPFLQLGAKPDSLLSGTPVPPLGSFTQAEGDAGFALFVRAALPYQQAELIAKENFLGEEFSDGKRSVTIKDIAVFGEKEKLVVSLDMEGTFTGKVELSGRPVYKSKSNRIVLSKLDYTLKTKNFLQKTAGWVLKSTLLGRMQKELDFFMESNLETWRDLLQDQLNELDLPDGFVLGANVNELKVENTFLSDDSIVLDVGLSGDLSVQVTSF